MKLSIIIPCDKTIYSQDQLNSLLVGLDNQVKFNQNEIEILIIYSNLNIKFDLSIYKNINPVIQTYYINKPIGGLKQFGLDVAQGDYIFYMSPDLILYCVTNLIDVLQILEKSHTKDLFLFNVVNCNRPLENGDFAINNSLNNIEGKIYKKSFLQSNNIHFLEYLNIGEDTYFAQKVNNSNPQYQLETFALCLQIGSSKEFSIEELFDNDLTSLILINTEYCDTTINLLKQKIIEITYNTYKFLLNYSDKKYVKQIESKLIHFIQAIQKNIILTDLQVKYNNNNNSDENAANESFEAFLSSILENSLKEE